MPLWKCIGYPYYYFFYLLPLYAESTSPEDFSERLMAARRRALWNLIGIAVAIQIIILYAVFGRQR